MTEQHRRRIGSVRPSRLMFTSGVGSLVDLLNISVLVRGVDDWNYSGVPEWEPIAEPWLLAAVQAVLGNGSPNAQVRELRPAPWLAGLDQNPAGPAAGVGVPTAPFPAWLRCTACNLLNRSSRRVTRPAGFDPMRLWPGPASSSCTPCRTC